MEIDEMEQLAREAAAEVAAKFDKTAKVLNDERAASVALLDPEEVFVWVEPDDAAGSIHSNFFFKIDRLQSVSLCASGDGAGEPEFDEFEEDVRDHFAERAAEEGPHMSVKRINVQKLINTPKHTASVAAAFTLECRFLANLPAHPNIAQLYAMHADDFEAPYLSEGDFSFFAVGDYIPETLLYRLETWRQDEYDAKEAGEVKDEATERGQLCRRLEVVLDVASALQFLADQGVVYLLHPSKVGFDSKYNRVKLFDFGQAREEGKFQFYPHKIDNMHQRTYLAPEHLVPLKAKGKKEFKISCRADVYSFGMMLWETLKLGKPFANLTKDEHMNQVVQGNKLPKMDKKWPNSICKLLKHCWKYQALERPFMKEIFSRLEECLLNGLEDPPTGGVEEVKEE